MCQLGRLYRAIDFVQAWLGQSFSDNLRGLPSSCKPGGGRLLLCLQAKLLLSLSENISNCWHADFFFVMSQWNGTPSPVTIICIRAFHRSRHLFYQNIEIIVWTFSSKSCTCRNAVFLPKEWKSIVWDDYCFFYFLQSKKFCFPTPKEKFWKMNDDQKESRTLARNKNAVGSSLHLLSILLHWEESANISWISIKGGSVLSLARLLCIP